MNELTRTLITETIETVTTDPMHKQLLQMMCETVYVTGKADGAKDILARIKEATHGR